MVHRNRLYYHPTVFYRTYGNLDGSEAPLENFGYVSVSKGSLFRLFFNFGSSAMLNPSSVLSSPIVYVEERMGELP